MHARVALVLVGFAPEAARAQESAEPTCEIAGRPTLAIEVRDGTTLVVADAPGPLAFEARASFGPLEHRWSVPPVEPDATGTIVVDLSIPREAFLHDLAVDWTTNLDVFPIQRDGDQEVERFPGVDLVLAWPNGRESQPVVWDPPPRPFRRRGES